VRECLNSLDASISDCRTRRDELLAQRRADTCTWFFADTGYRDWAEDDKLLLWIPGAPGSGKSVLSAILTEEMAKHGNSGYSERSSIAYFFFRGTDKRLRSDSAILKHLLTQVLNQDPWMFHHFEKLSERSRENTWDTWNALTHP